MPHSSHKVALASRVPRNAHRPLKTCRASHRRRNPLCNSRTSLALALVLMPTLAVPVPSNAAETVAEWVRSRTSTCLTAFSEDLTDGPRCLGDRVGRLLVDEATRFMTEQGRGVFGEHFRLVHRISWSPLGQGLAGELDAVIPLSFRGGALTGAESDAFHGRAFFLQQGVTRWTDEHGFRRHDVRLGTAFRFTLPRFAGEGVLGTMALMQENVERGHQRLVLGTDYAGRWGHASLQHYIPTTDWRAARSGYEERAVGGTELSVRLDLTTTLALDTAMGRWERDGSGRSAIDGRIGLGWNPHPYVRLDAGTGLGPGAEGGGSFRLSLNVPFGGPGKRPKWEGLGTFAVAGAATPDDLWRPVENVGRIRTIERVAPADEAQADGVTVRFLQPSVSTGDTVEVEVSLSVPAAAEVRLSVRLAPGSGDNPAVAGVDYVDEPSVVTIGQGATSGQATFRLLDNPALDTDRTLTVTVTRAV